MSRKKRDKAKTKPEIFKLFSIWVNLPSSFLGKNRSETQKSGAHHHLYQDLLSLRNRAAFSKRYGVSQKTLSMWSKEISTEESDLVMQKFFNKFTKSLLFAFYESQIKKPTPGGILTWYKIVHQSVGRGGAMNIESSQHALGEEEKVRIKAILAVHKDHNNNQDR